MAIENILLAVGPGNDDRVDSLATTTIDLAGPTGATVTIARVSTGAEYGDARTDTPASTEGDAESDGQARRLEAVETLVDRLEDAGIGVSVADREGEGGSDIVALVEDAGADLAVVGGRKRSPTGKAVFGSTAQRVLLSAPCPVTFVRDDH